MNKHMFIRSLFILFMTVATISINSVKADFTISKAQNLGPTINPAGCPNISSDGLELYLSSTRSGGSGQDDLWVARRQTRNEPWGEPVNLGSTVNSSYQEWFSTISQDGLLLYFSSTRPGGSGGWDLWMTTRSTKDEDWSAPVNLGPTMNSPADEHQPNISADGRTLLLCSTRSGGCGGLDIWMTNRDTKVGAWGPLVNLGPPVNSPADDGRPSMSSDGLSLFFRSDRPGGFGGGDIWLTMRDITKGSWKEPINLGPMVNTASWECAPSISCDGSTLYFHSNRPGGYGSWDIWQVSIEPVFDLNDDGIVDAADMCIMIDHWGEDYPLCDIGPMPWGDGIVDVEDMKVLAEHLFTYPGTVAYWTLDEMEGDIAYDSVGICNGTLSGGPVWQPAGGQVNGAIELDGVDDYIIISSVLNPADGPFSIFAWVKGGAPGQAIVSETNGANWLSTDPLEGHLITELSELGRSASPLLSEKVITDGSWHRIGFVWDGLNRSLYVDDILVAEDTQQGLASSIGGLNIGCGMNSAAGTFWSGLVDDVRIYSRAISPWQTGALLIIEQYVICE